jgi:hypothetical protein
MSEEKALALRLADALVECFHTGVGGPDLDAAAELRRLHAVEKQRDELLASLKEMVLVWQDDPAYGYDSAYRAMALITKAEGV